MQDPSTRPADSLAAEEATVRSAARGAQADRDRLALQLSQQPGSKAVADDLQAIESELDGYRRSLDRIAGARRALAAATAADTKLARQARFDAHRAAALAAAADRAKAAGKVEKAVRDLGAALVAEANAGQVAWSAAYAAARLLPDSIRRAAAISAQIAALGNPSATLALLNGALLGAEQVGSALGRFVQINGVHGQQPTPAQAAQADAERLAGVLSSWSLDAPAQQHDEFLDQEMSA